MIDEPGRRRPGFTAGGSAGLADGQTWTFPRIRIRLRPGPAGEDGRRALAVGRTAGGVELPRLEEWIAAITSPPGTIAGDRYWQARMEAAAALLALNYELADGELAALLVWDQDDDDAAARWDQIDAAILGTGGPKASSAT